MQYTEQDLKKLIETVEQEFTAHLAKAEGTSVLAKAEEAEEKKDEPKADDKADDKEESKEEPKAEDKKEESHEAAPEAKEEAKADESAEAAPEAKADEAQSHDGEEACDYDEEDLEHLHKMYSSMKKAELKVHHDSVRAALDKCGMAKCGDMSMAKSEEDTVVEVTVEDTKSAQETELLKSEIETYKSKAESLQKNLDAVQEFLTKFVGKTAPQGKAITSLDVIAKSEVKEEEKTFNESEISKILTKKAAEPTLAKSDREAINEYYLNGKNINIISHLLK